MANPPRRRLPKGVVDLPPIPTFTRAQVEALEARFPVRMLEPDDDIEVYRHYAGAAALVQLIKAHCPDLNSEGERPGGSSTEEDWDAEAEARARSQME